MFVYHKVRGSTQEVVANWIDSLAATVPACCLLLPMFADFFTYTVSNFNQFILSLIFIRIGQKRIAIEWVSMPEHRTS